MSSCRLFVFMPTQKKKSNVTHVKEKSNIRFRSCSVNAAREELLSLKPGSSHPTTQTLQRSGTGKPRLIYLASKRRVEDTADREREREPDRLPCGATANPPRVFRFPLRWVCTRLASSTPHVSLQFIFNLRKDVTQLLTMLPPRPCMA